MSVLVVVVFLFSFCSPLKTRLVAFRDLNFVFSSAQSLPQPPSLPQPLRQCHSCFLFAFCPICRIYVQLNNQFAAISGGRLRSTPRKKFSIAGAFSAQADNGERLRKSAEVFGVLF
jgi:hypothetical protein